MYRSTFEHDRGKVDMSFVVDNLPLNIFLEFIKEPPNNDAINTLSASALVLKEHARELTYLMDKLRFLDPIDVKALALDLFELIRSYKSNNTNGEHF